MSSDATTLDPAQLAAFRQQAGPIVALERGLTPACRRKLAGVARELGIAEEQIDAAVHAISAEPEAPPNPQAERFRSRLRKDLTGKTKTIIAPTIEQQIVAKAAQKYSLDEAQARQVVGEVAAELGLTRITAGEAVDSLAAQIDDVVQDSTWLAREAWDRLRTAGDKWGIDLAVVEELIEERLAANREQAARRQRRTTLALAAAGGAVLLAVIGGAVFLANRSRPDEAASAPAGGTAAAIAPAVEVVQPAWWDVGLAVEMANAKSTLGGLSGACDLMASSAADQRAAGYERIVAQAAAQPQRPEVLAAVATLAAACLALEPDESAVGRLQSALVALLPSSRSLLERQPPLALSFWAADTFATALARRDASAARKQTLSTALSAALGGAIEANVSAAEQRRALRARVALAAYRELTAAAPKEPAAVAARYRELAASAAELLPEDEWLRAETALLAAALPAAGSQWKTYEAAIGRCVSATDPLPALKLLETYRRVNDSQLSRLLAEQLVLRAGVQPKSWSQSDVIAAVRKGLGGASRGAVTAADRWMSLQEQVTPALERTAAPTTDPRTLLVQTVELAHLTTLAMALAQGDAGFADFDAAIGQPPQLDPPAKSDAFTTRPAAKRTVRALTMNEQRELARLLDVLSNHSPTRQVPRESALRAIAEIAATIPDVPPRAAESLAAYLLAAKSPEEASSALARVADLRRWLHLRLAVADGLANTKLAVEQQRELVAALLGETLPPDANLAHLLLENARRELDETVAMRAAASTAGRHEFDAAAGLLQQSFLARARLLSVPAGAVQAAHSPAAALELSLLPLAESAAPQLGPIQQAARYLAADDLHQTVAWQRLLIEYSARRAIHHRPQQAAAAHKLSVDSPAANVLGQLRDQERTLLQLWMLYAPEL